MRFIYPLIAFGLVGCAELGLAVKPKPVEAAAESTGTAPAPPAAARTVEQFDTTTQAQRVAASQGTSGGKALGTTVASLGDPSQPGFWIETSLVTAPGSGRIKSVGTGESADVDLVPLSEGSARVSLAAWRLLDLPLTELATLEVFEN